MRRRRACRRPCAPSARRSRRPGLPRRSGVAGRACSRGTGRQPPAPPRRARPLHRSPDRRAEFRRSEPALRDAATSSGSNGAKRGAPSPSHASRPCDGPSSPSPSEPSGPRPILMPGDLPARGRTSACRGACPRSACTSAKRPSSRKPTASAVARDARFSASIVTSTPGRRSSSNAKAQRSFSARRA